ncbi:sensor histidine kinase [Sphaerimonospora sp. CA-214678]|uniref:sensor histidine kinase n=1 Tax=Sphaerimonospora sp. CA-214678 TaxID=3240029 RepID=UPI003D90544F
MDVWWRRTVDVGMCLAVLVTGLTEVWLPLESRQGDGDPLATSVQVLVVAASLWWRRTHPIPTTAVTIAGLCASGQLGFLLFFGQFVPFLIAVFSVARHGKGREPWIGAAMAGAGLIYADLFIELLGGFNEMLYHWGVVSVCFAFGRWQSIMARHAQSSQRRAVAAEVAAAEQAAQAVIEERTRIARELHDIVAHAMSVMVVQAGAAEQMVTDDPDRVRGALATIRRTGSGALAEMRRVVTMLRDTDEVGMLSPQPGLSGLRTLVDDARESGLPVEFVVAGEPRALPAGLDLAAFRIVQEALTNARRHAKAATEVTVAVTFSTDKLRIDVRDDGRGRPGTAGTGHGLIGMRERATLYGGTLQAAPLPDRGFAVAAVLPLEPA